MLAKSKREKALVEAAETLIVYMEYHNKNLTNKQEWLIEDLRVAAVKYYNGDERPRFRVYAGEIK